MPFRRSQYFVWFLESSLLSLVASPSSHAPYALPKPLGSPPLLIPHIPSFTLSLCSALLDLQIFLTSVPWTNFFWQVDAESGLPASVDQFVHFRVGDFLFPSPPFLLPPILLRVSPLLVSTKNDPPLFPEGPCLRWALPEHTVCLFHFLLLR